MTLVFDPESVQNKKSKKGRKREKKRGRGNRVVDGGGGANEWVTFVFRQRWMDEPDS